MAIYYNSNGDVIRLGKELGRGGEGTVYVVSNNADSVAKIYHEPISADKAEKLRQMVALQSDKLLKLAAWVIDTLHDTPYGNTVGFLMPKIDSGAAIHELYNPRSRRQHFPEADWRFLIAAAANLARAFSIVHGHRHVIGDVNHGNVVISRDATVRLIDCDSYHLNAPEKSFLCEVGVSTHTPPELQGHSLRDIERTANHDSFGLAVLIFQLLFMGRHPFSGAFLGAGENTLENSIKEQRFAYADDAEARQMRQPPGTLPLSAVSSAIKNLFERAFLQIENRPTAREWIAALDNLGKNLQQCSLNSAHFYLASLDKCAWCRLEADTGVMFFPARLTGEFGANGEVDLYTLGQLIDAIKPPDLPQNLLVKPQNQLVPTTKLPVSPKVQAALANYNIGLAIYLAVLALAIILLVAFVGFSFLFYVVQIAFGCFWVCWGIIKSLTQTAREEAQLALDGAHQKWQNFKDQWNKKALLKPFESARAELKQVIKEYGELPKRKEAKLKELALERRQHQLEFYLSGFSIDQAAIAGLDNERTGTLKSSNIKTAVDITPEAFAAIPKFSFLHRRKLLEWRAELEKQFNFKPTAKMKQDELQTVENEIAAIRLQLEDKLRSGLPSLQQIAAQTNQKYYDLSAQSETFATEVRQAESDSQKISDLQKTAIAWTIGVAATSFIVGLPVRQAIYQKSAAHYSTKTNSRNVIETDDNPPPAAKPAVQSLLPHQEWGEAGVFYRAGEEHFLKSRYQEAIVQFEQAARLRPDLEQIHKRMAEALHVSNRLEEAVKTYERAIKIDPADSDSLFMLGVIYKKLKRSEKAIEAFKKAVKISPEMVAINYELGVELRKAKQQRDAIKYLKTTIELNPENHYAHYELGLCYVELGYNSQARDEYNELLRLNSSLADQLYGRLIKKDAEDYDTNVEHKDSKTNFSDAQTNLAPSRVSAVPY